MGKTLGLSSNEIQLWRIPLDGVNRRAEILAPAEQERAARFAFQVHRTRYINAHVALREILARYTQAPAGELEFQTNDYGKPFLASDPALYFNLAHSHALALLAVTRQGPVGVDIEYLRSDFDALSLAERFFAPREVALVREQPARFFEIWTRKEAFIKAIGMGVSFPLQEFDVCDERIAFTQAVARLNDQPWFVHTFEPEPVYTAAVVTKASGLEVHLRDWSAVLPVP